MALLTELGIDGFFRMDYAGDARFVAARARRRRAGSATGATRPPAGVLALRPGLRRRPTRPRATCAEAAALVDGMSDDEVARCRRAINSLACAEFYLDRYEDAQRHSERALRVAVATGQGQLQSRSCSGRG